tara:strand:+ start:26670 stop:26957 length:288 start_codon:yes stop_codon:yes gene_type:complete
LDKLYNDLNSSYEQYEINIYFQEEREIARGENKGEKINAWVVSLEDNSFFDTIDFLTISDETGEPLYFQMKHRVYEIFKNEEGKYYLKIEEAELN